MEIYIKDNSKMIKLMVNVNILGKMDKNMMGNGSKD